MRARRWDMAASSLGNPTDTLPGATPDAELSYVYDAYEERVLKAAEDDSNDTDTLYIFDSLEVRRATYIGSGSPQVFDYARNELTEVPYLFAGDVRLARVVHEELDTTNCPPTSQSFRTR